MVTAIDAFNEVRSKVDTIVNSEPQSMATMEPLDEWRQGDVRIIRLPDDFVSKHGVKLKKMKEVPTQLAPGTSIGSRHCLDSTDGVEAYSLIGASKLDGPVLLTSEARSITHPEHGDCIELPAGCYTFPGQRTVKEERVID